jgi:PAS domain S-box-containing protein
VTTIKTITSRKPPFFRQLYVQLTLLGAMTLALSILLFAWRTVNEQSNFAFDSIKNQAETLAANIASASGNYIVSENFAALEQLLIQSAAYREVLAIRVSDRNGTVIGNVQRDNNGKPQPVYEQLTLKHPDVITPQASIAKNTLVVWVPIENASLGWMQLDYSLATIDEVHKSIWRNGIIAALISIVLSVAVLVLLLRRPMRSISKATDFARELYKTRGQTMDVERSTYEVEQLEHALNFAARRLYDTNKDLNDFKFALDSHAIVGMSNSKGNLAYINDRFCDISGYTRDELIGKSYNMLSSGAHSETFYSNLWNTISNGQVWHGELQDRKKDGSLYWVDTTIVPFVDNQGIPYQYISIQADISERKEAERKLQEYREHLEEMVEERTHNLKVVNRELESFCYSVSHDLRAPLRSIDGFSQALLEDYGSELDKTAQDYLVRVRSSTQRMGQLIDDLLKLSHVVRSDMSRLSVDMAGLARNIESQLRERYPDRNVEFIIKGDLSAKGDERLLLAMLENLLGNAWKFTANREDARVELGESEQDGRKVYYVKDNGAGFDEAYVHKLFEPFQRLHSVQEYEGTGIGLATVQRIIRRHGGEVWAEGKIDQGATIYFTLGESE